jgi:histidinol-phosphatase (PHP family)
VRLSARSGLFGAIGHLDYVKKFTGDASYLHSSERLRPTLEKALRAIIASGAALEISTKGLVAKSRDYRPSLSIVRLYRRLGGRNLTIGSDAHDCQVLGTGVGKLQRICEKMGLRVIAAPGEVRALRPAGSGAE